jgi:beta-lactamase superfamily II metal-dependent hydrolase
VRFLLKKLLGLEIPPVLFLLGACALSVRLSTAQTASPEDKVLPAQHAIASRTGAAQPGLSQIVPGVYLYKDTCNVFAVVKDGEAVLIDFGSGEILNQLPSLGVRKVGWILHTHFHRDQTQGDQIARARGIKIAAPAVERKYFDSVETLWNEKKVFDLSTTCAMSFLLYARILPLIPI